MTDRYSLIALLFFTGASTLWAQQPGPPAARPITLAEAVDMALKHNHAVRLARLSVEEKQRAIEIAKSAYFPSVRNDTIVIKVTDTQLIEIPVGGLAVVANQPIPAQRLVINQGGLNTVSNGTGIVQPLTQLFRVSG